MFELSKGDKLNNVSLSSFAKCHQSAGHKEITFISKSIITVQLLLPARVTQSEPITK